MGNCLASSSRVENAHSSTSDPSKASSKLGFSSQPACTAASSSNSRITTTSSGCESTPTLRTRGDAMMNSYLKAFTFNELRSATRNFRPDSLIGEGGFGYVFKAWIDEQTFAPSKPGSGLVVAVKKLKPEGFQGHKEWLTEVHYLGQLHHPNLVKLLGYCEEGNSRLLVYEYMAKGSLENHLFRRGGQLLSWPLRIKIAVGAAKGLSFLHDAECQVIYRDVKSSNILLDTDFNTRLSDFGLAKDGPTGDRTHVSTKVMGTQGYAAPEYVATGRLSTKADVYSFGVVLLELLSGRRAVDPSKFGTEQSLVEWATPYLDDKRKLFRIIDTRLEGQYSNSGAHAVAKLALRCLDDNAKLRPRMSEVLETLERLRDLREATGLTRAPPPKSTRPRRSPLHPSPPFAAAGSRLSS